MTRNELRVAALELFLAPHGALSKAERRELARLDAEAAATDVDAMSMEQLDQYLLMHAQDPGGLLKRHAELQRRARTPEQVAADEAFADMLSKMSNAELDDYAAMQAYLAPPDSKEPPS